MPAFASAQRGLRRYPDVSVVCGPREVDATDGSNTVLNPALIVEVTSRSSRGIRPRRSSSTTSASMRTGVRTRFPPRPPRRSVVTSGGRPLGFARRAPREKTARFESIHASLDVTELYSLAAEPIAAEVGQRPVRGNGVVGVCTRIALASRMRAFTNLRARCEPRLARARRRFLRSRTPAASRREVHTRRSAGAPSWLRRRAR